MMKTEAEYIATSSCCAQILWIKQQLSVFGVVMHNIPIFYDNTSVINIIKNAIQHSCTKYIEIRLIVGLNAEGMFGSKVLMLKG